MIDLVDADAEESGTDVADLIAPFDDLGVEILLDLLADEEDREQRARLLGVARRIVPDRVPRVTARLSDPRWYVVRNATILPDASGRPEALPHIEGLVRHSSPAVRREVPPRWRRRSRGRAACSHGSRGTDRRSAIRRCRPRLLVGSRPGRSDAGRGTRPTS
jgi:hypothetical protein